MAITKFFDLLNVFFEKKAIPTDEEIQKHCNIWMLNNCLSCDMQLVELAHEMAKLKISNKMYFDCMYYGLPKGKRYIPYNAKKTKAEMDVVNIMEYFSCSQQVAKEYYALMDESEIEHINEIYNNRGIKKC